MQRHFEQTRKFFQLPQAFKDEIVVDGNSRCVALQWVPGRP